MFEKTGLHDDYVTTGFDAIHEILSGDQSYDLVFMDWMMPEMTGTQALTNVQRVIAHAPSAKLHWQSYQLPVILFSGKPKEDIPLPDCRDLRVLDMWDKSIPYQRLFERVSDTFLELKKLPVET
jgi:CheY-like chemotaxis protein